MESHKRYTQLSEEARIAAQILRLLGQDADAAEKEAIAKIWATRGDSKRVAEEKDILKRWLAKLHEKDERDAKRP